MLTSNLNPFKGHLSTGLESTLTFTIDGGHVDRDGNLFTTSVTLFDELARIYPKDDVHTSVIEIPLPPPSVIKI